MKTLNKAELYRLYFSKKMTLDEIGELCNVSHSATAKRQELEYIFIKTRI